MAVAEKHHIDRVGPARWWNAIIGPAILFLIAVGFFWKLVLSDQYTWLAGNDTVNQVLPWFQFQAGEWHAGRIPLWDPFQWVGQPLLGQAQPGVAYPLNWLLFSLPLDAGWIRQSFLHWYFVLIHYMAAVFCYWLCRDLKLSRPASIAGGIVFAFSGYMGTIDWPQMLNGAVWAPLIFLFLLRAERGEKPVLSSAVAGAFLGMSWLSGHHQVPIFLSITCGFLWLWIIFENGRPNWRKLKLCTIFFLFLILISGVQVLPGVEYGRLATRWAGAPEPLRWADKVPYGVHTMYSLPATGLLGVILPGIDENADPFLGVIAFTLAIIAIFHSWRIRQVRIFTVVGLAGLLYALGRYNLFHGILYSFLPLVEKARNPSHAILIFNFAFATLAAFGIDALDKENRSWRYSVPAVAGFGVFLLLINVYLLVTRQPLTDDRIVFSGFLCLLFAGILAWFRRERLSGPLAVKIVLALILVELSLVATFRLPDRNNKAQIDILKSLSQHADIADFLRQQNKPFRVEVDDKVITYNFGDWYGIEDAGGYVASITNNLLAMDAFSTKMRNVLGVGFLISKQSRFAGWQEVYRNPAGAKVFANPSVFPRTWTVHAAESAGNDRQLLDLIQRDAFDARRSVALRGSAPKLATCQGEDRATLLLHQSNRVEVGAEMACAGMLIVADTWFPGWKATVDGKSVPIYEAYGCVRGVEVPAGRHTITMVYRPDSVLIGGGMTLAGVLGLALLGLFSRRRTKAIH